MDLMADMTMDSGILLNSVFIFSSEQGWSLEEGRVSFKENVYSPTPTTILAHKTKIISEFQKIPETMVMSAVKSMKKRANLMVFEGGRQFEGVS